MFLYCMAYAPQTDSTLPLLASQMCLFIRCQFLGPGSLLPQHIRMIVGSFWNPSHSAHFKRPLDFHWKSNRQTSRLVVKALFEGFILLMSRPAKRNTSSATPVEYLTSW